MYSYTTDRYGMHPRNIFICYSGTDITEAERVAHRLEGDYGVTCWYAERNMPPGSLNATDIISEMIEKCDVFLLVSSTNTSNDQYVQATVSQALALGKKRLELKIDKNQQYDLTYILREMISIKKMSYRDSDFVDSGIGVTKSIGAKALIFLFIAIAGGVFATFALTALRAPHVAGYTQPGLIQVDTDITITFDLSDEIIIAIEQAQVGDKHDQYKLGHMFLDIQDFALAAYWFRQAAENGHVDASIELGSMYQDGRGLRRSNETAAYWFYNAAKLGNAEMQYWVALRYWFGSGYFELDQELAQYWFYQAAMQDHVDAQAMMGVLYLAKEDLTEAINWFRRAAMQGHAVAQSNVGISYILGDGGVQCNRQAAYWFHKSAMQDNSPAQVNLAWMYESGYIGAPNPEQAFYWMHRAAVLGEVVARSSVGTMYFYGRGVSQCYYQAEYWLRQAAMQGYGSGMAYLALMYELGTGVEQDYEQAIHWYKRATDSISGYTPVWVQERLEQILQRSEQ